MSKFKGGDEEKARLDREIYRCVQRIAQLLHSPFDSGSVTVNIGDGVPVAYGLGVKGQFTSAQRDEPLGREVETLLELYRRRDPAVGDLSHSDLEVRINERGIVDFRLGHVRK